MTSARELRVAAVQMQSENGRVLANLGRAVPLVEQAARAGAELIVLPEFMPTGYIFSREVWDAAEPRRGPTVQWLGEQARRLGVYLGTSFLEADGQDFYNTFVLAGPGGTEAGRVRKQTPASFEAFYFRGSSGPHAIQTEIATIGVGICYENMLAYTPRLMHQHSVDLMLMPHSAPAPARRFWFPQWAVDLYNESLRQTAPFYAELLGVPVVFVNKCGPWRSPLPGLPLAYQDSRFPGLSAIVDSDGEERERMGDEEGVIVETVTLDPRHKRREPPPCHGYWARELPAIVNLFRTVGAIGGAWYRHSAERRRRALRASSPDVTGRSGPPSASAARTRAG